MEQLPGKRESPALGPLVQAVGDNAVAFAILPGLEGHGKILGDALRRRRVAVALAKLSLVTCRQGDEGDVKAPLARQPLVLQTVGICPEYRPTPTENPSHLGIPPEIGLDAGLLRGIACTSKSPSKV